MTTTETLTFGIEIECTMPSGGTRAQVAQALIARGIDAGAEYYNHDRSRSWKLVTDGSITGGNGCEVVSPILTGEAGLAEAEKVCEALEDFGCSVNRTCGFHVHVGAPNRELNFFKNLTQIYSTFEPVIDSIMPASRRASNNAYCRATTHLSSAQIKGAASLSQLSSAIHADRYSKLNLHAMDRHGTVEFRQHSGTLNARKVSMWVRACLRMVAKAANGVEEFNAPNRTATPARVRSGTKLALIVSLMSRPEGCTTADILQATGWPSVSVPQQAASAGIEYTVEQTGRIKRYRAATAQQTTPVQLNISIDGWCDLIGAEQNEREFFKARAQNLSGSMWAA